MPNVRPQRFHKGPLVLLVMLLASGCALLAGLGDFSEGTEGPQETGSPVFEVRVDPSTVVLAPKEGAVVTVTLTANPPLGRDALIHVEGLPPGVTVAPIAIARPAGQTATGTINVRAEATAGRATGDSRVVASADPLNGEATMTVRVLGPPVVFDTPKTTTYQVPEGVTSIYVKMWGAGGGGGMNGAVGGAGAFVFGRIEVTPGETLTLRVGAGGGPGTGGQDAGVTGGGGGAGLTGIFRDVPLMIAGSGGGGGAAGYGGIISSGAGAGGAGGGDGGVGNGTGGGAGGSVGAGGAAGTAGGCDATGTAGRALVGGTGAGAPPGGLGGDAGGGEGHRAEHGGGGGGGAGAFGGGGGGCGGSALPLRYGGSGGGGGSSLATGKEARILDGSGAAPGGATDPDYDGRAGRGGGGETNPGPGAPGRIVIRY